MDIIFQWPPSFRYGPAVRTPYTTGHTPPSLVQNKTLYSHVCQSLIRQDQEKSECWELQIGTCFEPSYLLISAAVCFCPAHSCFWTVCHPRVQKHRYRLLFQTCIQRVPFHTSHETRVHHLHCFADLDGTRSHRTGHNISCSEFTKWFCSSL